MPDPYKYSRDPRRQPNESVRDWRARLDEIRANNAVEDDFAMRARINKEIQDEAKRRADETAETRAREAKRHEDALAEQRRRRAADDEIARQVQQRLDDIHNRRR